MNKEEAKNMGATHKAGRKLVKNLRENTPNDSAYSCGYIYAYDFFDGKRWHGCVCKAKDFFNLKPLLAVVFILLY